MIPSPAFLRESRLTEAPLCLDKTKNEQKNIHAQAQTFPYQ